ncbi:MAG: acyl carrier protein [Bacteroidota bacterium]
MPGTLNDGIRSFIVNTFLFGEGGDKITDDDSLLAKGIVDSTGVLELVAYLEETHGVQVTDQELVADNFDSINKLAAFIQSKRG